MDELFGNNYRVPLLSTLYQTVEGIIIPSLKSSGLNIPNKVINRYV